MVKGSITGPSNNIMPMYRKLIKLIQLLFLYGFLKLGIGSLVRQFGDMHGTLAKNV